MMIKPSGIIGYYHFPMFWYKAKPSEELIEEYSNGVLPDIVFREKNSIGIELLVRRDGFYALDLESWLPGSPVDENIFLNNSSDLFKEDKNYVALTNRVVAMNLFLLCLHNGIRIVERTGYSFGPLLDAKSQQSFPNIEQDPRTVFDGSHFIEYHALVKKNIGFGLDMSKERDRSVVSVKAIEKGFEIFSVLLSNSDGDIISLCNSLIHSTKMLERHDPTNSLTLSWVVLEKLISKNYTLLLSNRGITGKRKQKLNGIDYTASIKCEILELTGNMEEGVYKTINKIRKARNNWMHGMKKITNDEARIAIGLAMDEFNRFYNTDIFVPISTLQSYVYK